MTTYYGIVEGLRRAERECHHSPCHVSHVAATAVFVRDQGFELKPDAIEFQGFGRAIGTTAVDDNGVCRVVLLCNFARGVGGLRDTWRVHFPLLLLLFLRISRQPIWLIGAIRAAKFVVPFSVLHWRRRKWPGSVTSIVTAFGGSKDSVCRGLIQKPGLRSNQEAGATIGQYLLVRTVSHENSLVRLRDTFEVEGFDLGFGAL